MGLLDTVREDGGTGHRTAHESRGWLLLGRVVLQISDLQCTVSAAEAAAAVAGLASVVLLLVGRSALETITR